MKKRNSLYFFIVFFFYLGCKSQKHDYRVIHLSNNEILSTYYFHPDHIEYARVYGSSFKNDSIIFNRNKDDLIVKEFNYDEKQKKRVAGGSIRYINYYTSLSDIIVSGNLLSMDEVPVSNFNFTKKDLEIESIIKENCKSTKEGYSGCDFIFPKNNGLPYLPESSTITSAKIKKGKDGLEEIEVQGKYEDAAFNYKRNYYYDNKKIKKIITSVKDNTSVNSYEDAYSVRNQK
ncbi:MULTISPECIES: hypothetical protein [unclassified Chryseobacterium]|uniref:hypothetical protein n=1 Tax=unclassified Chryseobacterium TaxID=2593645 RepID=UPI001D9DB80E|nr:MULTISPECIES: hypothetical protein [unclassified Chryseobacterium]MCQ9633686.1 hypothetical protein [Chryseobacterium sp. WG23]CAH0180588.1 hypothetical protein SRABI04_01492 [Chryseobacterium sp. Bi04]